MFLCSFLHRVLVLFFLGTGMCSSVVSFESACMYVYVCIASIQPLCLDLDTEGKHRLMKI